MEINKLLKKKQKAIKDKNENALCAACTDLADCYMKEETFLDAINEYLILAKLYKKQKKMIDFATVHRGIGEAFMLLTNYEKAIEHQKIYLGVSREQENILEEQRALATLGHTYLTKYIGGKKDKQDLNLAFKYTLKSLEVCESLTDMKKYEVVDMTARLYNNLGVIQEYQGHHDKSMEFFNKAIVLCKANDVYESLHQAYNSLASLLERKGEYNNAIQNFNLAIDVAKKLRNNSSALCDCLVSKSNILLKLGDFQAAKKSLQKAYKLKLSIKLKEDVEKKLRLVVTLYRIEKELVTKTCSDAELQKFYEKMGDAYSGLGCFDCAIEYYLKMLDIAKRTNINLASCYYSLAVTYRDDEQFDKAVEYFEKEYELCEFKKGLDTLCEIADTKESNACSSSEVIAVYERAVNSCREANSQREEGRMLNRLISYLDRSGNPEQIPNYQERFNETGFVPSDSEDSPPEGNSEDDVSLSNLTDDSEDSECGSPSKKRKSKNFQVRRNLRGETQLHTACISGKINVVQHLLVQGHPVNIRDNGGWLPIHDACISGHFEIVKLLLDNGAAVNDRGGTHCNGITPLHDAAVNGHLDIIQLLLNRGASALAKTDEGETAYHYLRKTSLEMQFDEENKKKCENLLEVMSVILDKAGQSREINSNIKNTAFVSVEGNAQNECGVQRRRVPKQNSIHFPEADGCTGRNWSTSSSSDEDNDEVMVERKKIVLPKTKATNEYKMVMSNLRKKVVEVPSTNVLDNTSVKRSAFVMRDDTNDDDWLEDDLGGTKMVKKRKMNYTDGLINSSHTRFTSSVSKSDGHSLKRCDSLETVSSRSSKSSLTSKNKSPTKQSKTRDSWEILNADEFDTTEHAEDPYNCDEFVADSNIIENASSDDDFVDLKGNKNKQQISLLDAGFMKCTILSDNHGQRGKTCQKRTFQPKITHFGNTTPTKTKQSISNRSTFSPKKWTQTSPHKSLFIDDDPMLALDVNIEGRPFRITTRMSLKNTLTVKWLALEAARRYAKKEYVEPVLELMTESGAELVNDDLIGTLFITDSQVVEVHAKVLKWNLPLVRERYKEACSDMNTKPLDSICQKLDTMTISLDMKNYGFLPQTMAPLCKVLLRENRLLELDLSNNFLSLDCIKLLSATLPTLENLTKLNLCCTNLHMEEIRCLSNMFSSVPTRILSKLYSLDLSENFISDASLQDLCTFTKHLNLKELNLSLLNFTEDVFKQSYNKSATFNFERIEMLNLMGNNFGNDALLRFLSFVSPATLTHLDVSNNRVTAGFLTSLIQCLCRDGVMLNCDYLNLTRCEVGDMEVFNLLRSSDSLETLNLSYTEVTSLSLRRLLESPIVRNIILLGCDNINKYFDDTATIWILENHSSNKKSLKISCDDEKFNYLINLWKIKYCDKVLIQKKNSLLSMEGK